MSDPKDFLSRWSQRKLKPETEQAAPEKRAGLQADAANKTSAPAVPAPEFDITTLPSLDSIAANSDIRAFLQQGVPESLRYAALRRAWSTDPAIRDFIGLSENAWDFNAPDSMPGFGPLNDEQVREAAAWLFRDPKETTAPASEPEPESGKSDQNSPETKQAVVASNDKPDASTASAPQRTPDIAMQHEQQSASDDLFPPKRRHGGALPE